MKNLILTTVVILAIVLNTLLLTSCSKNNDEETFTLTPKLLVNEAAVDAATGTFTVNGVKVSLAKFLGFSKEKSASIDTSASLRIFYAMYLINKPGSADTTINFYGLSLNVWFSPDSTINLVDFAQFGDSVFYKTSTISFPSKTSVTRNLSVNVQKQVISIKELTDFKTPTNYTIKVVSVEKDGNYFRGLVNNNTQDTLTFYKREITSAGPTPLEKKDLYNLYKKTKLVVKESLPITNLNELSERTKSIFKL